MKRKDLKKIALLGLTGGITLVQSAQANENSDDLKNRYSTLLANNTLTTKSKVSSSAQTTPNPNDGNLGYHLMSEDELLLELNQDGQRMYNEMDPANKRLALEVASGRCANTNLCGGLNACKTDKNDCAGKASCKGNGKCGIADKNLAIRLVYTKMMKKRNTANGSE